MNARPADDRYPVLVGDIGGTNARFASIRAPGAPPEFIEGRHCADFPGPFEAIQHYLAVTGSPTPRRAGLAVATPVSGDQVRMTNSHWSFSRAALSAQLGLEELLVLNDFAALALALPHLHDDELRQVGGGAAQRRRPLAVLGPGTGLGVSGLLPCDDGWVALSGEGGHVSCSPVTPRESAIVEIVRRRYPHVSAERLICGDGLVNLYRALAELGDVTALPLTPEEVSARGLNGECAICNEALGVFCAMLGTVASNLVLTLGATGGVYIGGGIVPRLGDFFVDSAFRARFEDKGRFTDYLAAVPSFVITAAYPALHGVAGALHATAAKPSA